jgi:hypothetical protein
MLETPISPHRRRRRRRLHDRRSATLDLVASVVRPDAVVPPVGPAMCLLGDATIVDGGTDAVQPSEHDRLGPIGRRVRQAACRGNRQNRHESAHLVPLAGRDRHALSRHQQLYGHPRHAPHVDAREPPSLKHAVLHVFIRGERQLRIMTDKTQVSTTSPVIPQETTCERTSFCTAVGHSGLMQCSKPWPSTTKMSLLGATTTLLAPLKNVSFVPRASLSRAGRCIPFWLKVGTITTRSGQVHAKIFARGGDRLR